MSKELRNKIAYWLFLILGAVGISIQIYKLYNDSIELTFSQGVTTTIFAVFILRPNILLEAFNVLLELLKKLKNNK